MSTMISCVLISVVLLIQASTGWCTRYFPPCEWSFERGLVLQDARDYAGSIPHFLATVRACPRPRYYHALAHSYQELRQWPEAEAAFDSALEDDPRNGGTRFCRGILYYLMGKYDLSLKDIEFALETALDHHRRHQAVYYIGLNYLEKGNLTSAASAMREAINLCGDCTDRRGYQRELNKLLDGLQKERVVQRPTTVEHSEPTQLARNEVNRSAPENPLNGRIPWQTTPR